MLTFSLDITFSCASGLHEKFKENQAKISMSYND